MNLDERTMLRRLGAGGTIDAVCAGAGMSRAEFDEWWRGQLESRLPDVETARSFNGAGRVEILRDETGTPHVYADTAGALFFGYGFAMAQDRLWQLDYLRRKAVGRLSEVLGPDGLETDIIARTVGINRIAADEIDRIPGETKDLLEAFSNGINAAMEEGRSRLPIEFDLLDYEPEPWSPVDSIAVWAEFRWYLTGRLPVIALPEMARRALGDGPLYQAFLLGEAEDESIVPPGHYPPGRSGGERVGEVVSDPDEGLGSNNWVIGGALSDSGLPILASDPPHRLRQRVVLVPGAPVGRGVQRGRSGVRGRAGHHIRAERAHRLGADQQHLRPARPLPGEGAPRQARPLPLRRRMEAASEVVERIDVKGADPVTRTIRSTRNGPLADEIVPRHRQGQRPRLAQVDGPRAVRRDHVDARGQPGRQRRRDPRGAEDVDRADVEASGSPTWTATSATSRWAGYRSRRTGGAATGRAGTRPTSGASRSHTTPCRVWRTPTRGGSARRTTGSRPRTSLTRCRASGAAATAPAAYAP